MSHILSDPRRTPAKTNPIFLLFFRRVEVVGCSLLRRRAEDTERCDPMRSAHRRERPTTTAHRPTTTTTTQPPRSPPTVFVRGLATHYCRCCSPFVGLGSAVRCSVDTLTPCNRPIHLLQLDPMHPSQLCLSMCLSVSIFFSPD